MHSSRYNWWIKSSVRWKIEAKNNDKVLRENREIIQSAIVAGIDWKIIITVEVRICDGISSNFVG